MALITHTLHGKLCTLNSIFPMIDIAWVPSLDKWTLITKYRNIICSEWLCSDKINMNVGIFIGLIEKMHDDINYYLDAIWC